MTKYPNLVVKMSLLNPETPKNNGGAKALTLPTMKLFIDGAEAECTQLANKLKMEAMFEKANTWYNSDEKRIQQTVFAKQNSKYIKTKEELKNAVANTEFGSKQPLIVKFCRPCQFIAPIIEEAQRNNEDVVLASCDLQQEGKNYVRDAVRPMPNCFSYVNGKLLKAQKGINSKHLLVMIAHTR